MTILSKFDVVVRAELNPTQPVQAVCDVIMKIAPFHPGREIEILKGVQSAIENRINEIEKEEQHANNV